MHRLITPEATLPVNLDVAKNHLGITHNVDDALLEIYLRVAVEQFQQLTCVQLAPATWEVRWDDFPPLNLRLILPITPYASTVSFKYIDTLAVEQDVPAVFEIYSGDPLGQAPATLHLKNGKSWPAIIGQPAPITLQYIAGYLDLDRVPWQARAAILEATSLLYLHRTPISIDTGKVHRIPEVIEALQDQLRLSYYA